MSASTTAKSSATTIRRTSAELAGRKIASLRVTGDFLLSLRFRDGLVAEINLTKWLAQKRGSLIKPLRDIAFFAQVFLDHGVLTWPNGFDLDPDTVRHWAEQGHCD